MPTDLPPVSAEETVRRAETLYEQQLSSLLEKTHVGQYIAIDTTTGDYETGSDYHAAARTLRTRQPDALIGVLRIGYPAVGRIRGRVKAVPS